MEAKMTQLPPRTVMIGSAQNYRGVPEHYNRPIMVSDCSQTTRDDFKYLYEVQNREKQYQKERKLEEKIKLLEKNIKAHEELFSQIHATSARTTLLSQQLLPLQYNSNVSVNDSNCSNISSTSANRPTQVSPKIVNGINSTIQQVSVAPAESVKYTIIAEGRGNENGEPIEVQLAEDDGALNLNSSAESGRLEICLAPEDNIKTDCNNEDNNTSIHHQMATATTLTTTPSEHHYIKRRKLAIAKVQESLSKTAAYVNDLPILKHYNNIPHTLPTPSLNKTAAYVNNLPILKHYNNIPHTLPVQKRRSSGNSLLKTPKVQINNIQTTPMQNIIPTPTNSSSTSSLNSANDYKAFFAIDMDKVMIPIGPNQTRIPGKVYKNINWSSATIATRKLLMTIFERSVLATHSMSDRPSPAFEDHGKPIKRTLDPLIIDDIIFAVTRNCGASEIEVRKAINTNCAYENKMMKLQVNKRKLTKEMNKENMMD